MKTTGLKAIAFGFFAFAPVSTFATFPDVPSNHENAIAINYVQQQGIVSGYPDGTFRPNDLINRAEFVKILVQAQADESAIRACYDEVEPAHWAFVELMHGTWYAPYVCYAKKFHLIDGYPDGTFRPTANINFVEAAKIIVTAMGIPTIETDTWYMGYVSALAAKKAVPISILSYDQQITRGEMAEMIWRLHAGITDRPSRGIVELQGGENEPGDNLMLVQVYLAQPNDSGICEDGTSGCYYLYVPRPVFSPQSAAVLQASVEALLTLDTYGHGCYASNCALLHGFYLADLHVTSATIVDGVAHVSIEGQMASGGIGDDERMIGQLNATIMQFPSVKSADVTINGKPLKCIADQSGLPPCN